MLGERRLRKSLRAAGAWSFFLITWIAAIAIAAIALPLSQDMERRSLQPVSPISSTVGARETDSPRAVIVSITRDVAQEIKASTTGLVTAVYATPGSLLQDGEPVIEVDGRDVLAYRGERPLWRDLTDGDSGEDVRGLGNFLVKLGLLNPGSADAVFGPATLRAVQTLQKQLGVEPDGVMRTAYVAFMPGESPLADVTVRVGDAVDSQLALATLAPPVSSVVIRGQDGVGLADVADAEIALSLGDKRLPLSSLTVAQDSFVSIAEMFASAPPLSEADPGLREYDGATVRLQTPLSVGSIPASAVYVDLVGKVCIFVETSVHGDWEPVAGVSDTRSVEAGVVYTQPELSGKIILSNPAAFLGPEKTC